MQIKTLAAALFAAALMATPGLAKQDYVIASVTQRLPDWPTVNQCYQISSKRGWQRLSTSNFYKPELLIFDIDDWPLPGMKGLPSWYGKTGWTVDAARYSSVGALGHEGKDAASLEPFAGYKFRKSLPFGALLARTPKKEILWMDSDRTGIPQQMFLDFRINDSDAALGDNKGFLVVCVAESL